MDEYEVPGANDSSQSSRQKDRLFADPPKSMDDGERALAEHRAAVHHTQDLTEASSATPAEGMLAESVPERHAHSPYEPEAADATEADADFDAEEKNKKEGTA